MNSALGLQVDMGLQPGTPGGGGQVPPGTWLLTLELPLPSHVSHLFPECHYTLRNKQASKFNHQTATTAVTSAGRPHRISCNYYPEDLSIRGPFCTGYFALGLIYPGGLSCILGIHGPLGIILSPFGSTLASPSQASSPS